MENRVKTRTEQILTVMNVLTWIVFIGLLVEIGALLVSYGFCWLNPEAAKNFYRGLDLYSLRQYDLWFFTTHISFMVALSGMKVYMIFLLIKILSKVNLKNPFTLEVAGILQNISYLLAEIWLVMIVGSMHSKWLSERAGIALQEWNGNEFLFVAGLVFIISQIFKRGVEMQTENELTV